MMDSVFKMMDFVFKMMDLMQTHSQADGGNIHKSSFAYLALYI